MALKNMAVVEVGSANIDTHKTKGISDIWRGVRARLRSEFGAAVYAQEIARLRVKESGNGEVMVIAPSAFDRSWIEDHAGARIRAIWAELDTVSRSIRVIAEGEDVAQPASAVREKPVPDLSAKSGTESVETGSSARIRFTFDTFRVGPANELAAAAARTIVGSPNPPFNLVFFYGDYGVGKTHLMHAIAAAAEQGTHPRRSLYLTAEEFLSGFVSAMKARDTISFKEYVRNTDMLLIDDVHFIAGKPKTEDEFLHTIAALMAENKQVVLASHQPPTELHVSDDRLRSLLAGGLACPLSKPDLDLRREILDCKIAQAKSHYPTLEVPESVRDFLAARITSSARELEGVLNNVICRTALLGLPVTMDAVSGALRELQLSTERRLTVDDIQKAVARHFGVTPEDICSKRRTQSVVRPRHIAMYLAKTMTTRSLPDIGRRFGGRDHSTVIHAVNKVAAMINEGDAIGDDIETLTRALRD